VSNAPHDRPIDTGDITRKVHHDLREPTWFRKNGRVFFRIKAGGSVNPETLQWVDFPLSFGPAAPLKGGRNPNGAEQRL